MNTFHFKKGKKKEKSQKILKTQWIKNHEKYTGGTLRRSKKLAVSMNFNPFSCTIMGDRIKKQQKPSSVVQSAWIQVTF